LSNNNKLTNQYQVKNNHPLTLPPHNNHKGTIAILVVKLNKISISHPFSQKQWITMSNLFTANKKRNKFYQFKSNQFHTEKIIPPLHIIQKSLQWWLEVTWQI